MYLFKASGRTYDKVAAGELHAFRFAPREIAENEFVLLSKNREDCTMLEKQIQRVAKVFTVRARQGDELEVHFPDVEASERWGAVIKLYFVKRLVRGFNLAEVPNFDERHYRTVQGYAPIAQQDQYALLAFLAKTNESVLLDFLNNADRPAEA